MSLKYNISDFYYLDKDSLKLKYEYLSSGIEGDVYKMSSLMVAKKFHHPRQRKLIEVSILMNSCNQTSFYSPFGYLFDNDMVLVAFSNYFKGNDLNNINKVDFDILISSVSNFIKDIEKISNNGILINEGNLMINEEKIVCVDTTMFDSIDKKDNYDIYIENLKNFFYTNGFLDICYIDELRKYNNDLNELYFDLENFDYFYKELRNTFENIVQDDVKTIDVGIKKMKKIGSI